MHSEGHRIRPCAIGFSLPVRTVQEVASSASYFDTRWPPGPLGVWAVAGIVMGAAAAVIAVVVYFLPPPPQLEEPRGLTNSNSLHSRSREQYRRQRSRSSASSRPRHATEHDSGRIPQTHSRAASATPVGTSSTGTRPQHQDSARMPPRHVQRIPHQGSYAEGAVDDPRHQPGGTEGGAQSPRSSTASRGEDAQCISSSTLSSSVTFAKGSGARILHVGQVTSSGSGEFPAHSRSCLLYTSDAADE